jgi:hypothetical protein
VKQPWLGLIASAIAIVVALAFIALFDFPTFAGPVAFYMLCTIPFQVMAVVIWGANPSFVAKLSQPAKGLVLLVVTLLVGALIDPIVLRVVGEGISPPATIPSHFAVIAVPITFWLAIVWGGWPFNLFGGDPKFAGVALLVGAYVLTWVIFRAFFDYEFLRAAPDYLQSAPHGMFMAVMALVFIVTALAVMFLVLCFDLWPLTRVPSVMQQPALGIVWSLICLAGAWIVMTITVSSIGMDPMIVLTRITAPFIFGSILVLNMFQNSLWAKSAQPLKGVLNAVTAGALGYALFIVYCLVAPFVSGHLGSGPDAGYAFEIWMANALLSVTFPFLIFLAAYFGYWPLVRKRD